MATQDTQRKQNQNTVAANRRGVSEEVHPMDDIVDYLRTYARQKPETAALVCIGIGFVLGWRLKPW
ncbi:MAG: hypothetical protein DWQ37_03065 [Planctomycetota bacterium]|nr:MAG: hypothetical protein DWQ37_03065 [Planctomycetota bacterium]